MLGKTLSSHSVKNAIISILIIIFILFNSIYTLIYVKSIIYYLTKLFLKKYDTHLLHNMYIIFT